MHRVFVELSIEKSQVFLSSFLLAFCCIPVMDLGQLNDAKFLLFFAVLFTGSRKYETYLYSHEHFTVQEIVL